MGKKLKLAIEKPSRKELEKRLMALWHDICILRAKGKCEYCGSTNRIQAHHIFSRKHLGTRWDPENGACLCAGHHYFAHHEPELFRRFLIEKRGQKRYEMLVIKAYSVTKFTINDMLMLEQELKKELEVLKNEKIPA